MSYADSLKNLPPSGKTRSSSRSTSPLPKKKNTELGVMEPMIGGVTKRGEVIEKRFESRTQTIKISEALPFSVMQLISLGELMTVRLSDERTALEYSLSDCKDKLLQVRPGEGKNNTDIVVFERTTFTLNNFHLHVYFDMRIKFSPAIRKPLSGVGLSHRILNRYNELKEEKETADAIKENLNFEEIYDSEAAANITGSPKGKSKEI